MTGYLHNSWWRDRKLKTLSPHVLKQNACTTSIHNKRQYCITTRILNYTRFTALYLVLTKLELTTTLNQLGHGDCWKVQSGPWPNCIAGEVWPIQSNPSWVLDPVEMPCLVNSTIALQLWRAMVSKIRLPKLTEIHHSEHYSQCTANC
jgi:hypothetical protein